MGTFGKNFPPSNEWQKPKLGISSLGLTVAELIAKLKKLKQDSLVVLYDIHGNTHAIQAIQDSPHKVAIF